MTHRLEHIRREGSVADHKWLCVDQQAGVAMFGKILPLPEGAPWESHPKPRRHCQQHAQQRGGGAGWVGA